MHTDDSVINDSRYRQTLKAVRKCPPETDAIPALALIIKPIDLVDVVCFVISSKEEEVVGIFDFICEKKANALNALLSPIHVIAMGEYYPEKVPQKQVVCLLRRSPILE